ncbi:MAG: MFS transporter [Desulfurellaceae bacterium]|nr:MFS transporter [Desulfurellaceae bacterium]
MDKRVFYTLNIAVFTSMLGMGIVLPFMPIYARTLGATGITIGIFFASFPLAQMVFMPLISRLSDRHGRKMFMVLGLLGSSLLSLWYVYAPNMLYLTLGRFLQGAAVALTLPIATAYVGDIAPPEKRGTLMGIFNLSMTSSIGLGPLVGGWLSDQYGMEFSFYWMCLLNALACGLVLVLLPSSHSTGKAAVRRASYRQLLARPRVKGLALYRVVNTIQMGLWFSFLPLLGTEILNINHTMIGWALACYMLVSSLVQVPFGRMADRFSKRLLIITSGLIGSFVFSFMFFVWTFWHLLLIAAVTGAMGAMAMPALNAMAAEEGQDGNMGAVMGMLNMAMSVGMMLGPVLGGLVLDVSGLRPLFIFGAVAGVLGTFGFARLTTAAPLPAVPTPRLAEGPTQAR